MTKTYYVSQTETHYIIYKDFFEVNVFADKTTTPRDEIEDIGNVYVDNNGNVEISLRGIPLNEMSRVTALVQEAYQKQLTHMTIRRDELKNARILKLTQRLSDLDISNRHKKKALRQADKDLKFLRSALDESYQEYNNVLKRLEYSEEENKELRTTNRELRDSLDASITGEMLDED